MHRLRDPLLRHWLATESSRRIAVHFVPPETSPALGILEIPVMPKKTTKKAQKKSTKKAQKKPKCHPDNHSGNPRLDRYIGWEFDWCEPWEWEEDTMPHDLLDEEGNPPHELCGLWRVDSVEEDGETAWVSFVPTDGDQQMEFPLSLIPDPEVHG